VLAEMVARAALSQSLMTEKLARRDVTVPSEYRPDPMTTTRVREVMTTDVATLPAGANIADALGHFADGRHSAYPVVDGELRCVGIVSRSDVLTVAGDDPTPLAEAFGGDVITVASNDTCSPHCSGCWTRPSTTYRSSPPAASPGSAPAPMSCGPGTGSPTSSDASLGGSPGCVSAKVDGVTWTYRATT
jgi:hypothetical protein